MTRNMGISEVNQRQNSDHNFYIGWDVGGWNCDKNRASRDALVILDGNLSIVGKPWRGNLRSAINEAKTTLGWIEKLFRLCGSSLPEFDARCVLAIDTPLGFSEAFVRLVSEYKAIGEVTGESAMNPYLFRQTELFLYQRGLRPLSPVKDMIGSQATKGMHVLSRFAPRISSCGVWTEGEMLTVIEAYPSACNGSAVMAKLRRRFPSLGHQDKEDALTCALVGYLYALEPERLERPNDAIPQGEGWIWMSVDALDQEE